MSHQSLTHDGTVSIETAWAKLNLGLKVLSRRQDGYHDVAGIFQTINLADTVHLTPADHLALTCSDPSLPDGAGNLAFRAAQAYLAATDAAPCHVHLQKRIPAGAGLGGGSADAAAVLRGLDRRSAQPLGAAALACLGAQLGSDVPFAVRGGTALVGGRGEDLQPLAWDSGDVWYVLVCPPDPVRTAWAYAELDRQREAAPAALPDDGRYLTFLSSARGGRVEPSGLWSILENDFQPVVEGAKPIVARTSRLLADTEPLVHSMSGSGSTVYGVYDDRIAARRAAERLRATGYPVFLCTPVADAAD